MPSGLVVKNGVNRCSATASSMPSPVSATRNSSTAWPAAGASTWACSDSTRSPDWSAMACRPLRARFSSTCSIMVGSHQTAGRSGATSTCTRAPSLRACNCTNGSTVSTRACGATAWRAVLRSRTRSRTLWITLPARPACSAMRSSAVRSSRAWACSPAAACSRFSDPLA